MTARTLPISHGGLSLVHQPTSRYPIPRPAQPQPVPVVRLFRRFANWWRQLGSTDLAWQEQRRLQDSRLLADSYRWITR